MKVAVCGYPPLAKQKQEEFKDIEFKFFLGDLVSNSGGNNFVTSLPKINFFEFRRLVNVGELDGVIIAENCRSNFTKKLLPVLNSMKFLMLALSI